MPSHIPRIAERERADELSLTRAELHPLERFTCSRPRCSRRRGSPRSRRGAESRIGTRRIRRPAARPHVHLRALLDVELRRRGGRGVGADDRPLAGPAGVAARPLHAPMEGVAGGDLNRVGVISIPARAAGPARVLPAIDAVVAIGEHGLEDARALVRLQAPPRCGSRDVRVAAQRSSPHRPAGRTARHVPPRVASEAEDHARSRGATSMRFVPARPGSKRRFMR